MDHLSVTNCLDAAVVLSVSIASGLLGRVKRQMNRLEERIERIEQRLGLDTSHYHRRRRRTI
jgi:hypothetical protein